MKSKIKEYRNEKKKKKKKASAFIETQFGGFIVLVSFKLDSSGLCEPTIALPLTVSSSPDWGWLRLSKHQLP